MFIETLANGSLIKQIIFKQISSCTIPAPKNN